MITTWYCTPSSEFGLFDAITNTDKGLRTPKADIVSDPRYRFTQLPHTFY
jgi:hypothetical protein